MIRRKMGTAECAKIDPPLIPHAHHEQETHNAAEVARDPKISRKTHRYFHLKSMLGFIGRVNLTNAHLIKIQPVIGATD